MTKFGMKPAAVVGMRMEIQASATDARVIRTHTPSVLPRSFLADI